MRIIFIRHGEPDYVHDTLTEKGWKEARLLSEKMADVPVTAFYLSPLGRAKDTAVDTLKKTGRKAEILDWLREFPAVVKMKDSPELFEAYGNETRESRCVWNVLPGYWTKHPEFYTNDGWRDSEIARLSNMGVFYDQAAEGLDNLLASYGYVRDGNAYRVEKGNEDTIVCFCHFAITCVFLSHLWGVSPFILWHSLALAPTSVTELVTEEREQGTAYFRAVKVGDVSHLYAGNETPSFAARFCETYGDQSEKY